MDSVPLVSLDRLAEPVTQLERVVEQIVGAPVPLILEGLQHVPQQRVQNSAVEKIGSVPVPQIWEPIMDGPHLISRERVQIVRRSRSWMSPQITGDGLHLVPQERDPNRTPEQIVDVLVPQITEDGLPIVSQEREQNRTREQIVDVLVPQITEDGLPIVPQERVQNRTPEQIVDVLVPQIVEERVQHRTQEQIADSLVPPIMEAVLPSTPQERRSRLRISLCRRTWEIVRELCVLHLRSSCRIVPSCVRPRRKSGMVFSMCLRSACQTSWR